MEKRLILLRHGEAAASGVAPDRARPLTPHGHAQALQVGQELAGDGWVPDLLLCSPALRTQETAQDVVRAFSVGPSLQLEEKLYGASADQVLDLVRATPVAVNTLMVIGHNPWIHVLSLQLLAPMPSPEYRNLSTSFPPASCVRMSFPITAWQALDRQQAALVHFMKGAL